VLHSYSKRISLIDATRVDNIIECFRIWIDYRADVLCAGLRKADEQTWRNALKKHKASTDEGEKKDILAALGCVTDDKIVKIFLESTFEKDSVIGIFSALRSVSQANPASIDLLIEFISTNIEKIRGE